jgi:hypothetical protein
MPSIPTLQSSFTQSTVALPQTRPGGLLSDTATEELQRLMLRTVAKSRLPVVRHIAERAGEPVSDSPAICSYWYSDRSRLSPPARPRGDDGFRRATRFFQAVAGIGWHKDSHNLESLLAPAKIHFRRVHADHLTRMSQTTEPRSFIRCRVRLERHGNTVLRHWINCDIRLRSGTSFGRFLIH